MKTILKHTKSHAHWLHMQYLLPIFAIGVLFLLAACGGGTTTGSSATPTATTGSSSVAATPTVAPTTTGSDSCSIVSATQATTILGGTVQTHSNSETVGASQATGCAYASTTGGAASLSIVTTTDATTAHATFTELQTASQATAGAKYQTVSGLGDAAFTDGKILYVLKGKTVMIITVANSDSTKVLPEEKQFAQAALPKVS
ncbi:MAG TPA: hypothetical protein VNG51_15060 [Ktedonobacteraceae bacterium]|nr:hypothetical protein [Ktedonobacteraceae bacterium]